MLTSPSGHPTKKILKVSPIAAFNKIIDLALAPGHLVVVSGFGVILTQKLGCFGLFQDFRGPKMQK